MEKGRETRGDVWISGLNTWWCCLGRGATRRGQTGVENTEVRGPDRACLPLKDRLLLLLVGQSINLALEEGSPCVKHCPFTSTTLFTDELKEHETK